MWQFSSVSSELLIMSECMGILYVVRDGSGRVCW